MPQNKKDCEIDIKNDSYIKLYEILKLYEAPALRDIFLQQVAYNCAIRMVALDFMGKTDGMMIKLSNLAEYGLDTYSHTVPVLDHDVSVLYDIDKLILDFPFFDEIKSAINEAITATNESIREENSKKTSKRLYRNEIVLMCTKYEEYFRYPIVQKIMNRDEKEKLMELFQAVDYGEAFVLATLQPQRDKELPDRLSDDNGNAIKLDALQITQAFYYFDSLYFYRYTKSMISRSFTYPDADRNQNGHGFPKLETYLNVMEKYILQKSYFNLI